MYRAMLYCLLSLALLMPRHAAAEQAAPLRLATLEYPPFIYLEQQQPKGILYEIVAEVFRRLQQPITVEFYPVPRGLLMVKNGDVDGYFSLKQNPSRDEVMLFTRQPLVRQRFVLFARNDADIQYNGNIEELADRSIGIVSKTSYGPLFDNAVSSGKLHQLEQSQNFSTNFKKLAGKRIELVINSYDVGQELIRELGLQQHLRALEPAVETVDSFLAFTRQRDYSELANAFDNTLCSMIADGTIEQIKSHYPNGVALGY